MGRLKAKPGVLQITPYAGSEAGAGGEDRIVISSNESAFGPSSRALEAYSVSSEEMQRYPEIDARSLRMALADHHGLEVEKIICGCGSDQLINLITLAYAGPGDETIFSEHGFTMYPIATRAAGATPVPASETNLTADVDAILDCVNERTRIVFLANPNNPTGTYLGNDALRRLHAGIPDDVLLVLDAAYAEYVVTPDYDPGVELVRKASNVIMTRTFSKIFALASLRIGWAYGPTEIIDVLDRIRPPFNVSTPAIAAGIAALADTEHTARSRDLNAELLPWFMEETKALGLTVNPSVGNFVIVRFDSDIHAEAAYRFLFERGIVTRRVGGYGLPEWVRISIGRRDEMRDVLEALRAFVVAA
ncbi:MAG: histidinol-phosphate transaminase [Alphaproteobacteria bacterium]|nr:histidinol-phosphate transaminase [Alphaproteobacteria bacterium]HCP00644.1 histidinol-phosphate transaminase [Rhodospirillaceae bacterium]